MTIHRELTRAELLCPHGDDLRTCADCLAEHEPNHPEDFAGRFWPSAHGRNCRDCGFHPSCCICEPAKSQPDEYHLGDIGRERRERNAR